MTARLPGAKLRAALAAAGLFAAVASAQGSMNGPWVEGAPLPALRLPTIDRTATVDVGSLRGTRLLLIEFASW